MGRGKGGAGQRVPIGEVHDVGEIEVIELGPAPAGWRGRRAALGPPCGQQRAVLRTAARATAWVAAGGVAGSCVGNRRRRCGLPRGQHRAESRAASWTATAAAAVAAVSDVGILSRELGCV